MLQTEKIICNFFSPLLLHKQFLQLLPPASLFVALCDV